MGGCYSIIVAAGRGHRAGGALPKQYRAIAGRPMLRYSAGTFARHPAIDGVRVVIHPDDAGLYSAAVDGLDLLDAAPGGAERQDSVRLGLDSLRDFAPDKVLIHDAARPFVDAGTIERTVARLDECPAALAALPVVDTLKRAEDGSSAETIDRTNLWRAQTPQGFRYEEIVNAHGRAAGQALTDDAAVAEAAGLTVSLVEGSENNFKVTTEEDFARAEQIVAARMAPRVGFGFDVHAFADGDHVWLCGVRIPHERGLAGHSDADVGLHAITDAILGAIAQQDIGAHFPPDDPKWKDASSDRFLVQALELVARAGGRITHLDATLICEAPRIRPHHGAMVARIAAIAGLPESAISVKATTTERLGFTGRGEGIACQAVATIMMPFQP